MKIAPRREMLIDLLKDARRGDLVLPQFQRNFVWDRDDIGGLLVSLLQGHFIGSFLMLETDPADLPFAYRLIEGVPTPETRPRPNLMVLDGQQRLTSLHYVLSEPLIPVRFTKYPYRFFLSLDKVSSGDIDLAVFSERHDESAERMMSAAQFKTLVVPFSVLWSDEDWLEKYGDWLEDQEGSTARAHFRDKLRPKWRSVIERFRAFEVPVLRIDRVPPRDPDSIGAICAIFEKMNSTGVKLSAYDLLTARLYKDGVDLHALWKRAVEDNELLKSFSGGDPDEYGLFVLRTLSLRRGLDAKARTLINLAPESFESDWVAAARGVEKALGRMTSTGGGFGALSSKWVPYSTMVSPLAAMVLDLEHVKTGASGFSLVKRWYWSSVFTERYAGAVESVVYRDYQDFRRGLGSGAESPSAIVEAERTIVQNEKFSLLAEERLNAVYRGIMCLVALAGARDFRADDSVEFHDRDDHHIFPKAFLKDAPESREVVPASAVNSIVNRTLISTTTNLKISRKSPSCYLKEVVEAGDRLDILRSHFITADAVAAMEADDFGAFLSARETALLAEMRRRIMGTPGESAAGHSEEV